MSGAEAEENSAPGPVVVSGFGPDKNGYLRSHNKIMGCEKYKL